MGLPLLVGNPIVISLQPVLVAHRGRLLSGESAPGSAVYAAAFVRERKIILESALLSKPQAFRLILMHELFHFVWPRLGNNVRKQFSGILLEEWEKGARGELGESSGVKKGGINRAAGRTSDRGWRDYVCESFCDTAAWFYAGAAESAEFALRKRWRERRKAWFEGAANDGPWKC